MRRALAKRAHLNGCALFVCMLALFPASLPAQTCQPPAIDEYASVRYVHDGDTLQLSDGRKLRFIGINTPELARDEQPEEPYAREARQYVRSLLPAGSRIGLSYGVERRDRHGRLLAHIILANGDSLNQLLLEQGYAQYIAVPPNLARLECYRQAEQRARQDGLGLWRPNFYPLLHSENVSGKERGFHLLRGRIIRVGMSRKYIWLNLDGPIALRIRRSELDLFAGDDPTLWRGRYVEARGWIYQRKGQSQMGINHPASLVFLAK